MHLSYLDHRLAHSGHSLLTGWREIHLPVSFYKERHSRNWVWPQQCVPWQKLLAHRFQRSCTNYFSRQFGQGGTSDSETFRKQTRWRGNSSCCNNLKRTTTTYGSSCVWRLPECVLFSIWFGRWTTHERKQTYGSEGWYVLCSSQMRSMRMTPWALK